MNFELRLLNKVATSVFHAEAFCPHSINVGFNSKGKNSISQSHYRIRELQNISIVIESMGSFENGWRYFLLSECPSWETVI